MASYLRLTTILVAGHVSLRVAEKEISQARRVGRHTGFHRTWSKTLESLANPLGSLRVRLQATLRSVTERASELWVLLVKYSKPGTAHASQQGSIWKGRRNGRYIGDPSNHVTKSTY